MKRIISILLLLTLALSLGACGGEKNAPDASEPIIPSPSPDALEWQNENGFPAGVSYTEEYRLESDPGDGLSTADAALTLLNAVSDYISDSNYPLSITLYDLESVEGGECYLYSLEDGYGAVSRYALDYSTGAVYVLLEESGEYQPVAGGESSDPGDSNILNWWGEYVGDGFSIVINNFDGSSFNFAVSNLRNGEYVYEGIAAIDPDDSHLAVYEDIGFYLYEDIGAIDFLTSESGEWAHLRGQYTQN